MKTARLWNSSTQEWLLFDYNKVLEADKQLLTEEQIKSIEDFIRRTNEQN